MQGLIAALAAIALAIAGAASAQAATISVTTHADGFLDGACTLREAIDAAVDNDAGASGCTAGDPAPARDTIILTRAGPYSLTNPTTDEAGNSDGDLDVAGGGPITIRPPGSSSRTIDIAQADRAIELVDASSDLTLVNLTLDGGDVTGLPSPGDLGGTVLAGVAGAQLELRGTTVSGGSAEAGGGVAARGLGTDVAVFDSDVTSNVARRGGGLWIALDAVVDIRQSRLVGNSAQSESDGLEAHGGALALASAGPSAVTDTVVAGNNAVHTVATPGSDAFAGGIAAQSALTIRRSLISENVVSSAHAAAREDGGGMTLTLADSAVSVIVNSTFHGNQARAGAGISGRDAQGTINVVHSTFAGNEADDMNAGDHVDSTAAGDIDINLRGSLLTSSFTVNPCETDALGDIESAGFNVASSNDPDCLFGPNDLAAAGVNLGVAAGPPRDNGGPTATIALRPGSDALDFIPAKQCRQAGGTDQRGIVRPVRGGCEAGAYERADCAGKLIGANAIIGTAGADTLTGTEGEDVLVGQGGNDLMLGLGGSDTFCGGAGKDVGRGAGGRDLMLGEQGSDRLSGGAGADKLVGAGGRDALRGNAGRDRLFGGAGADKLRGGPGRDRLRGGPGRDDQRQ